MSVFRNRPHWYMLVFHYGLGIAVTWQFIEDLCLGQWKSHAGSEFFPWRQHVNWGEVLGFDFYWVLAAAEAILLVLYFLRIRIPITALLLGGVLFLDNLGSFLNHRLLMSLELILVSLCPVPETPGKNGYRGKQVYWNLDLIRWQLFVVYLCAGLYKINLQFLTGESLHNLFWMTHVHGMKQYPEWLLRLLQNNLFCLIAAWGTIVVELAIAACCLSRRLTGWVLPVAIGMHVGIGLLMASIWIFTFQVIAAFIAFLPDRTQEGVYQLHGSSRSKPPRVLLWILWHGYIERTSLSESADEWTLECPNGDRLTGYDAWVELLSLSPLTFVFAEMMRIAPARLCVRLLATN